MEDPEGAGADHLPNLTVVSDVKESGQSVSPAIHLLAENVIARPCRNESEASISTTTTVSSKSPRAYYTSAQWTPDGTSLLISSSLNSISTLVLPDDLLDPSASRPRYLTPQSTITLPEPTQVTAPAPYFSLSEPSSQSLLVGCRDHPLHIYHLFPQDDAPNLPLATYKLIRRETEEYITPSSLLWEYPGTHFLCGSTNRLDYFDATRYGSDGPILTIPTIPSKRHIAKGNGVGMKGTVSTLAASPSDANGGSIVAAGTWSRWIGLYDIHRTDKTVANWTVSNNEGVDGAAEAAGQGIVQVRWSPCGRYLVVNERQSTGLLVYDIRGSGQLLSVLAGRDAMTQQKLTFDVFEGDPTSESPFFEVWAGSRDGIVTVWEGVGSQFGVVQPSWTWKPHDAPVGSTVVHSSGSVVATCSGGWSSPSVRDIDDKFGASSSLPSTQTVFDESELRVWSIGG